MYLIILVLIVVALLLLIFTLVFTYRASVSKNEEHLTDIRYKVEGLQGGINRMEGSVKSEIATNRMETNQAAKDARAELGQSLKSFEEKLNTLTSAIEAR